MAERRKRITEKLSELHAHIEVGEPVAPEHDEPLQAAIAQIEVAVDDGTELDADHSILSENVGDLALNLEVSHPKLTAILNRISELLAGAGI